MTGNGLDGVFLDFFGTLADGDRRTVEAVCASVIERLDLPVSAPEFAEMWSRHFFEAIETSNHDAFRTLAECECDSLNALLATFGKRIDPWPYVEQLVNYWRTPPLHADTLSMLSALAEADLPAYLVTNADQADIEMAVERLGLDSLLAGFVTSEKARAYKPLPTIFELALEQTGWDRARVVHVGDSLHSDVGGAMAAGISAVWLCRPDRISDIGRHQPQNTVKSLTELVPLLLEESSRLLA
jgi:2-haloacid dehalogenase/putative hydrolase of the HAD superfamily